MLGFKSKKDRTEYDEREKKKRAVEKVAAEGKPAVRAPAKSIDFQIQAIIGNIIFSSREVWAYYDIPTTIYDFWPNSRKVGYANELTAAFSNIVKNGDRVQDCHIRVTNSPIDVDKWEEDYLKISQGWHRRAGFQNFIDEQIDWLREGGFFEKRVYLGVCLGRRHELDTDLANPFNAGVKDAMRYLKKYMDGALQIIDKSVTAEEITHAQAQEKDLRMTLEQSKLRASASTTEDLALLIKKSFYPAMPVPYLSIDDDEVYGRGDLVKELGSIIRTNDPKTLEFEQQIGGEFYTGYMATLTFKKFNETMNVPYGTPWIYASVFSSVNAPFDVSCRFSLVPAKKIQGEIEKGINETQDAAENAMGANKNPSPAIRDRMATADAMLREVEENKNTPWVSGTYRIQLTAPDKETLQEYCKGMMSFYDESMGGTKLVWTFHDQLDLMLEAMPGDYLRENSFVQTTNIAMLSTSGFNVLNQVGDW